MIRQPRMIDTGANVTIGRKRSGGYFFEKTTGEALLQVKGVDQGQGMQAHRRLHQWYGKTTDMGLVELRQRVLRPTQAKKGRRHCAMH